MLLTMWNEEWSNFAIQLLAFLCLLTVGTTLGFNSGAIGVSIGIASASVLGAVLAFYVALVKRRINCAIH
jgi:uncharacterized membrane protein YccC